jgi:superfamily II DNA/RNA helicase
MPKDILQLAHQLLKYPVEIKLSLSKPADGISQGAYICYETQKLGIIKALFKERKPERVIIFTSSKVKTKELAISIIRAGYKAKAMHSDLEQAERDDVMYQFRSGKIDILVATDIVARGIDIDDIQLVVNYDVPHDKEDYVHRIGRTARAGKNGRSITLVSEKDQQYFAHIEKFLGKDVEKLPVPMELGESPTYNKEHKTKKKSYSGKNGKYRGKAKKKSDSHR